MKFKIFDKQCDESLIAKYLESASLSHGEPIKSEDWFRWKYLANPFGDSILALAIDGDNVAGCVALGLQSFKFGNSFFSAAISFDTFVHPNYRGRGLFKTLISNAEEEAKQREVDFLLNFPNTASLKGFLNSGWTQLSVAEYWIRIVARFNVLLNIFDLKRPFQVSDASTDFLKNESFDGLNLKSNSNFLEMEVTIDYLKWRFLEAKEANYHLEKLQDDFLLYRLGNRGKLKEAQVLYYNSDVSKSLIMNKEFRKNINVIGVPISKNNIFRSILRKHRFMSVPQKTNVCYKILSPKVNKSMFDLLNLSGINYHTY